MLPYNNNNTVNNKINESMLHECERRISAKRQQVADAQHELTLLEVEAVRLYRQEVTYLQLNTENIKNARSWISMLRSGTDQCGKKIDRRRRYSELTAFDWLTTKLRKLTQIDDLQIDNIIDYCFGQGYSIEFTRGGCKYSILVPDVDRVSIEEYRQQGPSCFQIEVSVRLNSDSKFVQFSRVIGQTFYESEIGDIIRRAEEGVPV